MMSTLEQDYRIDAPVDKVWQALTDAGVMAQWTGDPVESDVREGGSFSIWGGDIHGTYTRLIPNQLIEQDWYGHDDPSLKYHVSFHFESDVAGTKVHMVYSGEIVDEQKDIDDWQNYYFNPIKKVLEK